MTPPDGWTPPRPTDPDHPAHRYARDVVAGRVVAGKWVRLACARHLHDLATGHERGLWFDDRAANLALAFCRLLLLSKGRWKTAHFEPQPWQCFLLGCVFGWKRADGRRRFREAYLEVARKNGKTETAAAIALLCLIADGEVGAEVYVVATKRDQARTTFDSGKKLARGDDLKDEVRRLRDRLTHEPSGSKFEPLGADADSLDSLNPSCVVMDEIHAWKSRALRDVMETGMGARDQPLIVSTTTAGSSRRTYWWANRQVCTKLLEGVEGYDNDELFVLVYCPDEDDDPYDPRCWPKGNPSLGVTVRADEIGKRLREAKRQGQAAVNAWLRLRLNLPTTTAAGWLKLDKWRRCADPVDEAALAGRACYGGLDLSTTTDLTAWALVFPPTPDDGRFRLLVRHFLPGDEIEDREQRDKAPYRQWADGRSLTLTDGDWVDYPAIRKRVVADAAVFRLLGIAYDRRFAPSLVQDLEAEGIECVPWDQGPAGMNTPIQECYRLTLNGGLAHQGDPLLDYEAENATTRANSSGHLRLDKAASSARIDGVAAGLNALGLAVHKQNDQPAEGGVIEVDLSAFGGW